MSLHPNFHGPGTSLSGRIQIGHKSGLFIYLFSVNIKPPRHRFGFSLAWGWQYYDGQGQFNINIILAHPDHNKLCS